MVWIWFCRVRFSLFLMMNSMVLVLGFCFGLLLLLLGVSLMMYCEKVLVKLDSGWVIIYMCMLF